MKAKTGRWRGKQWIVALMVVALTLMLAVMLALRWSGGRTKLVSVTHGEGGAFDLKPNIPATELRMIASLDTMLRQKRSVNLFEVEYHEINHYYLRYDRSTGELNYLLKNRLDRDYPPDREETYHGITPKSVRQVLRKKGTVAMFKSVAHE